MSKRFVDYYLEAVTKKSGGGGGYPEPTGTINITSNGTHNVKDKATANVNVQPSTQTKSVSYNSNGQFSVTPSSGRYLTRVDVEVNVPTGGGGAEIIIPDNSLSVYVEGEGDPMDAQSVVNWYDLFDPSISVNCTFQGAMPSVDDKVLLTGDVVSSVDFVTKVGRYAIWGVCGSFYDGVAIQFSEASGYSVVDEEMPMDATTLTESEAYTNESGGQKLTVDVQGGASTVSDDVIFIDYDDTIVYSYSKEDFLNLTAMPADPQHEGLTSQGWNWSLSDAQTYVQKYGRLTIGECYITDDGKTRIQIALNDSSYLAPYLGLCINGEVEIDWGDGSPTETATGSSDSTPVFSSHTYADVGEYTIEITCLSGKFTIRNSLSGTTYYRWFLTDGDSTTQTTSHYISKIEAVHLGSDANLGIAAFYYASAMRYITIPKDTTIGSNNSMFYYCYALRCLIVGTGFVGVHGCHNCYSLRYLSLPNIGGMGGTISSNTYNLQACHRLCRLELSEHNTGLGGGTLSECYDLEEIVIPDTFTRIYDTAFSNCTSLTKLTIPAGVTTLGKNVFASCYGMKEYHFLRTTPPSVGTSIFPSIEPDCIIYVPYSSDHSILNAYKTATNWSAYASYMQEEPQ